MIEVTKAWLSDKIKSDASKVIGRALLAIYNNQTSEEKNATTTRDRNGIGFSKPDSRIGSLGARQYAKHKTLPPWQIKTWTKVDRTGFPRICKYAGQLNEIAKTNQQATCLATV